MKITEKMYLLAKEVVKEYESLNLITKNLNDFQVVDPEFIGSFIDGMPMTKKFNDKSEKEKLLLGNIDVYNCFEDCLEYFPDDLKPTMDKDIFNWKDTIDKLNRLEHLPFDDIVLLVKSARQDPFWAKNFLSITKLRRKDKDKIPYWKVFAEKFKQEKTKTEKTYDAYEEARKSMNL
jgi:hypothetical protein